jgi:hypothetical protein
MTGFGISTDIDRRGSACAAFKEHGAVRESAKTRVLTINDRQGQSRKIRARVKGDAQPNV